LSPIVARFGVGQLHFKTIGAIAAVVAHVQTSLGTKPAISRIEEQTSWVLRVVAQVVKAINVGVLGRVASIKRPRVQGLHRDDTRTAILEAAHVAASAVNAAARQTLVTVAASTAILVTRGIILVRGALGQQTRLPTEITINIYAIGPNAKTDTAHGANEAWVGLVALGAAFIRNRVDIVQQGRCGLVKSLLVGAVIIDSTGECFETFLNIRHVFFFCCWVSLC